MSSDAFQWPSESYPSDSISEDVLEQARIAKLAATFKVPRDLSTEGPHFRALHQFLHAFDDSPSEKLIWDQYRHFSRFDPSGKALIEEQASAAGLSCGEFIARQALHNLQRFAKLHAIPGPPDSTSADGRQAKRKCAKETSSSRSKRRVTKADIEVYVASILESRNVVEIEQLLTASGDELSKKIGCNRKTLMHSKWWLNDRDGQRERYFANTVTPRRKNSEL